MNGARQFPSKNDEQNARQKLNENKPKPVDERVEKMHAEQIHYPTRVSKNANVAAIDTKTFHDFSEEFR